MFKFDHYFLTNYINYVNLYYSSSRMVNLRLISNTWIGVTQPLTYKLFLLSRIIYRMEIKLIKVLNIIVGEPYIWFGIKLLHKLNLLI